NGLSSPVARLVLTPARDETPHAAARALRADEQVARRPLDVVAADVAAEGRLTTQASEGGDAGHAVDRPGILAARSRDIGLLAVEGGQDLVDAPQGVLVHTLLPDWLCAATSPLTRACTIRTLRVKPTTSNHVTY